MRSSPWPERRPGHRPGLGSQRLGRLGAAPGVPRLSAAAGRRWRVHLRPLAPAHSPRARSRRQPNEPVRAEDLPGSGHRRAAGSCAPAPPPGPPRAPPVPADAEVRARILPLGVASQPERALDGAAAHASANGDRPRGIASRAVRPIQSRPSRGECRPHGLSPRRTARRFGGLPHRALGGARSVTTPSRGAFLRPHDLGSRDPPRRRRFAAPLRFPPAGLAHLATLIHVAALTDRATGLSSAA